MSQTQIAQAEPASDLERARNAYQYGNYALVAETLQPLLYPTPEFTSLDHVSEARRLLGLAYLWQRDEGAAEREFVALLTLRPEASLEPLVDPPAFVEFFDRIKARIRDQLSEIQRKQAEAAKTHESELLAARKQVADLNKRLVESESTAYVIESREKSRLLASLPFGVGQFQNHDSRKGIAFFASELLLGAASVSFALAVRLKWPEGTFPREARDEADALLSAQALTGAAFLGVAIWGIVDAHTYFVPRENTPPRRVPRDTLRLGVNAGPQGILFGGRY